MFEPYDSIKPDSIGLNVCYTIVEAHGGKTAADTGTYVKPEFDFRFRSSMNRGAEVSSELIFLVDDDDAVRASLQGFLKRNRPCENGRRIG